MVCRGVAWRRVGPWPLRLACLLAGSVPAKTHSQSEALTDAKDLHQLAEMFDWSVDRRGNNIFSRQRLNNHTRDAWWPGQSEDGKKHAKNYGGEVFPFEGGSDHRVPMVDQFINEDAALLMSVWQRMRLVVNPMEGNDVDHAQHMTHYLRWLLREQIVEAREEAQYLANYFLEQGSAVCGVFWKRERGKELMELTLEKLEQQAREAQKILMHPRLSGEQRAQMELSAELPYLIKATGEEDRLIQRVKPLFKDALNASEVRAVIRDLRETGRGEFHLPYVRENRPCLEALQPNLDVFIPQEEISLRDARFVFRRELVSEARLRDRMVTHKWDKQWVETVLEKHRGQFTMDDRGRIRRTHRTGLMRNEAEHHLYEVIHAYRRLYDKRGVPGLYHTVFHPHYQERCGYHDLLGYKHDDLPFVHFKREFRSKHPDSTRGYGEVGHTWQNGVKSQWDMRTDRTVLTTMPPSYHPPDEEPSEWGPGVQIPTDRPDRFGFMQPPAYDKGSEEMQENIYEFARGYFGRARKDRTNAMESQNLRQNMADNWMAGWKEVNKQILQLSQQFADERLYYRTIGNAKGQSIRASREDIQGAFDIGVGFAVNMLDPEYQETFLKVLERTMAIDAEGIIDRAEVMEYLFETVMPNLGERFLNQPDEKAKSEIEDEAEVLAKLRAGLPVDVQQGQNHGLRLNFIQQLYEGSPAFQEEMDNNETYRGQVETRVKQLQHQHEQMTINKQAGQLGAVYGARGGRPA